MNTNPHIERAISILGSQTKLADAVGCSQQNISNMLLFQAITAEMAIAIDRATSGAVSKQELRPDIFGHTSAHVNPRPAIQPRRPRSGKSAAEVSR